MILDNRGQPFERLTGNRDLARRVTKAARRLWRRQGAQIERSTPEAKSQPKAFQRGYALGVAALIAELHNGGVDVEGVLGALRL